MKQLKNIQGFVAGTGFHGNEIHTSVYFKASGLVEEVLVCDIQDILSFNSCMHLHSIHYIT